jgi:5-methylcytosine-specific restriction endonuclease McrA
MAAEPVQRRAFTQKEKDYVWNKANSVPGKDPKKYRQDICGNVIYYDSYGLESVMGWEIDHIHPLVRGGTYDKKNLQVLQWKQNNHKNDTYPYNYKTAPRLGTSVREYLKRK